MLYIAIVHSFLLLYNILLVIIPQLIILFLMSICVASSLFSLLKALPTLQEFTNITRCLPLPRTPKWHSFWINLLRFSYLSSIIHLKGLCLSHTSSCLIFHGKKLSYVSIVEGILTLKEAKNSSKT